MAVLNGLLTFYSWHHALRADKVLRENGFQVALIPVPREISSNCGTALRFEYQWQPEVVKLLTDLKVRLDSSHLYGSGPSNADRETSDANFSTSEPPSGNAPD